MSWDYSTEPPKQHGRSMLIALGCTLLGVCVQKVLADDYFSPALLDIDSPGEVKPTLVSMRLVPVRLPVNITLTFYVNNNKVASKEIEFTLKKTPAVNQPCSRALAPPS